jgi:hypothetical protein
MYDDPNRTVLDYEASDYTVITGANTKKLVSQVTKSATSERFPCPIEGCGKDYMANGQVMEKHVQKHISSAKGSPVVSLIIITEEQGAEIMEQRNDEDGSQQQPRAEEISGANEDSNGELIEELAPDIFEVKRIYGHKRKNGKLMFLVVWVGYDISSSIEDTWLSLEELSNSRACLEEYYKRVPDSCEPLPPLDPEAPVRAASATARSLSATLQTIGAEAAKGTEKPTRTRARSASTGSSTPTNSGKLASSHTLPNRGITTTREWEEVAADEERFSNAQRSDQRQRKRTVEERHRQEEQDNILSQVHIGDLQPELANPLVRKVMTPLEWVSFPDVPEELVKAFQDGLIKPTTDSTTPLLAKATSLVYAQAMETLIQHKDKKAANWVLVFPFVVFGSPKDSNSRAGQRAVLSRCAAFLEGDTTEVMTRLMELKVAV